MRAIPAFLSLLALAALGAGVTACDDNSLLSEPRIVSDTVALAVPVAGGAVASAIDLVRLAPPFSFRRFPEQFSDAQQWDVALRRTEGGLALRPFSVPGAGLRGAGIAVASADFDQLSRAPRGTAQYRFETTPIAAGATYVLRSRQYGGQAGGVCVKYAKLKVVEMDAAAGTARFAVAVNENCEDERLDD